MRGPAAELERRWADEDRAHGDHSRSVDRPVVALGGLLAALMQSRLGLGLAMLVLAAFLRRSLFTPRVAVGFLMVLIAIAIGLLPVINPVDHTPESFHRETLTVESVAILKDEILIRAAAGRGKCVLTVDNVPGRARALKSLRDGDVVRAWFIESNGYLWQLARGDDLLVRLDDRNREKQAEIEAILLYPSIILGLIGLALIFLFGGAALPN